MTEPQVWVLIGVFAAAMAGVITIVMTSFNRQLDAKTDVLSVKIDEGLARLSAELRLDMARLESKIDALDRDVSTLFRRLPEEPRA